MSYSDYVVFVDESGDHGLASIDRDYPVFVLDFCIFRKEDYIQNVVPSVEAFKFKHFGHDLVVLHEREIRKQEPPFVFLQDQERRRTFFDGLNGLIEHADFTIIATAIHKERLARQYLYPANPYELALRFCMERTYGFLRAAGQLALKTHVVVEQRGRREDNDLELAFRRIRDGENQQGPMPALEIVFADKKTNSAGLQLADLTARPIGRHVLDPEQANRAWEIVERKLYRHGAMQRVPGWGLKVFPSQ